MSIKRKILWSILGIAILLAAAVYWVTRGDVADYRVAQVTGSDPLLDEADAEMIPTVNIAEPIGWQADELPATAEGLTVTRFAEGLDHPRVLHRMPNGDILVTLTRSPAKEEEGGITAWIADLLMSRAGAGGVSADALILLRDTNDDGIADARTTLRDDLSSPSGIAYHDGKLYVANHDAVLSFDYAVGATTLTGPVKKLMDLPAAGNHWMRNLEIDPDGGKLYVAVGSDSNIGEKGMEAEQGRAAIHELDLTTGRSRIFASGLRNPNGLDF
ncbi:MAG: sorbosone dehydrogenase family protein, partial [Pontixanthobacter sp.]